MNKLRVCNFILIFYNRAVIKKYIIGTAVILLLFGSGCRISYLIHAGMGQLRLLNQSVRVVDALNKGSLTPEQKERLRLVARIKDFGEKDLGLKETQNYQTVYLMSDQNPIYTISAAPKDNLTLKTWWFPVVGRMPYLGFFDPARARAEKEKLLKEDLDVTLGEASAYSTLGWLRDPVTLNLIEGSTVDLVETLLHEMTHTTLYLKGQGEFNDGFAMLIGKVGALQFLEKNFGPYHPFTIEARKSIEDERLFSAFLKALLNRLEHLYDSPVGYGQKLAEREKIFEVSLKEFNDLKGRFRTDRFTGFGRHGLDNAYLLSIGLYHRHFRFFDEALKRNGNSLRNTIVFFRNLAEQKGDILEETK